MLQFSHFDRLFPKSLPIMLEVLHIILTKLVENSKCEAKRDILQHNRHLDIVIHTAGPSITRQKKTVVLALKVVE